MTEFRRAVQSVDDIEQLLQKVLDGGVMVDAQNLSQLVGNTIPVIEKLRAKVSETDPLKQTYGPQMREKIGGLVARWESVEGLARDVLQQKGIGVTAIATSLLAPPPPAPATTSHWTRITPEAAPQLVAHGDAVPREAAPRPPTSSITTPSLGMRGDVAHRRELAANAAETRSQGKSPAAAGAAPTPMAVDTQASVASTDTPSAKIAAADAQPLPRVARMDALLHLVHCVFLGHGFKREESNVVNVGQEKDLCKWGAGPIRVLYSHSSHLPIKAVYVPVQSHLIVYASLEGAEDVPTRVTVQLGMVVHSVQAKVDYLLLYPLIYRQCIPALMSLPPETCFGVLAGLAIPALAAVGLASRGLSSAVFEDDILWWKVLMALPPSSHLCSAVEQVKALQLKGETLPHGLCRCLVRDEVGRARMEAEERRQRREAENRENRLLNRLRDPLLVQPPRQPRPFPGGPGGFIIGGPDDLMPGGGFLPGPFGGRRPLGGGGGFGMPF